MYDCVAYVVDLMNLFKIVYIPVSNYRHHDSAAFIDQVF